MVIKVMIRLVHNLDYHYGLVIIASGVYNNKLNNMKDMIKQSIIGAIYIFMVAAMGAVIVIGLYNMAGR